MSSAEEKGKKLGFLIASLDMSAQEREALLALLPEMTEAQLEDLTNILETSYLQAATKSADKQLADDLKNIDQKYQEKIDQINEDAIKELDSIA
ncbi:MAG TPA: hypothetical protein VLK22_01260 [Candidatus Udaeobacter sp.]|nr:hypothetical protein [Candidatus Udaeobacter sp.]